MPVGCLYYTVCVLCYTQYPMDIEADSQVFSFAFFGSRPFLFLLQADQDFILHLPHVKHVLKRGVHYITGI